MPNDQRKYPHSDSQSGRLGSIRSKYFSSLSSVWERAQRVPSSLQHTYSPLLRYVVFFSSPHHTRSHYRASESVNWPAEPNADRPPPSCFVRSDKHTAPKRDHQDYPPEPAPSLGSSTSLGFCMTLSKACIPHWDADRQRENTKCSLPSEGAFQPAISAVTQSASTLMRPSTISRPWWLMFELVPQSLIAQSSLFSAAVLLS